MHDRLASLIERERAEIERRFVGKLRAASAAQSLDREAVIDSLHLLLDEMVSSLRRGAPPGDREIQRTTSEAGRTHAAQRFGLGYDVATLVREYALLQSILFDLIAERGAEVALSELRTMSLTISNAVADACTRYAHMRDEEQQRQASEHMAFLAHELRDPLGTVRLGLALAREQGASSSPRVLESMERGVERMRQMIDDALVEMRLRAGQPIETESIDLARLVESVVSDARAAAEAKKLELRTQASGDVTVHAEQRVIRSAVSNLVRNAVKFSHAGGHVVVRVVDAGGRVRLEVEDSCGGLPPGAVEKVFDPYVQIGRDRSGFGLGLAIAKQAAMAHGGEIRVHDLPGKGCVFVIDLPAQPE